MDHFFIVYVVNCYVYKNQHISQEISSLRDVQWRGLNMDELPYHMIEIKSKQSSRSIKFCDRFANSPIFSCYSYNDILIFSNERGERIF